jgi:hypothetical protein
MCCLRLMPQRGGMESVESSPARRFRFFFRCVKRLARIENATDPTVFLTSGPCNTGLPTVTLCSGGPSPLHKARFGEVGYRKGYHLRCSASPDLA